MSYVDGFLLAVPTKNLAAYKKLAQQAGAVHLEHGALEYRECFGDDIETKMGTSFRDAALAKKTDTVVFSWITYKSRAHRDQVLEKVKADPRMAAIVNNKKLPFNPKGMSYGGFEMAVDLTAAPVRAPAKKKAAAKRA